MAVGQPALRQLQLHAHNRKNDTVKADLGNSQRSTADATSTASVLCSCSTSCDRNQRLSAHNRLGMPLCP